MADKVYIVTSGVYSDYRIRAVFKDYDNARLYCAHFNDCRVEEYHFEDDDNWSTYNYVEVYLEAQLEKEPSVLCFYGHSCVKYDSYHCNEHNHFSLHNDSLVVAMVRRLPNEYSRQDVKNMYTKIWNDMLAELKYLTSDFDLDSIKQRVECAERVNEYLKGKFGIEDNVT